MPLLSFLKPFVLALFSICYTVQRALYMQVLTGRLKD